MYSSENQYYKLRIRITEVLAMMTGGTWVVSNAGEN